MQKDIEGNDNDKYAKILYKARHQIKQRMKFNMPVDSKSLCFYRGLELALIIINDCIKEGTSDDKGSQA